MRFGLSRAKTVMKDEDDGEGNASNILCMGNDIRVGSQPLNVFYEVIATRR